MSAIADIGMMMIVYGLLDHDKVVIKIGFLITIFSAATIIWERYILPMLLRSL